MALAYIVDAGIIHPLSSRGVPKPYAYLSGAHSEWPLRVVSSTDHQSPNGGALPSACKAEAHSLESRFPPQAHKSGKLGLSAELLLLGPGWHRRIGRKPEPRGHMKHRPG